jgi:hypothetical protein
MRGGGAGGCCRRGSSATRTHVRRPPSAARRSLAARAQTFSNPPKIPPRRPNPCEHDDDGPLHARNTANMKLNVKNIRYLSPDDWRVLTAVCARTRLSIA